MTKENTNMMLWDSVCRTDPAHTKYVNQRGGFTAIDAMYQIQEATRAFGPAGVGWGWNFELSYPPNNTVIATVTLWQGKVEQTIMQVGQKRLNYGDKPDEDAAKKAVTDGLTKCLSYLGFNADVFLGKFDNNKYVENLKKEISDEEDAEKQGQPNWNITTNPPPPEAWAYEAAKTIGQASTLEMLGAWWKENLPNIMALPEEIKAELVQNKNDKKSMLTSNRA